MEESRKAVPSFFLCWRRGFFIMMFVLFHYDVLEKSSWWNFIARKSVIRAHNWGRFSGRAFILKNAVCSPNIEVGWKRIEFLFIFFVGLIFGFNNLIFIGVISGVKPYFSPFFDFPLKIFLENIWWERKKYLPLQPQTRNKRSSRWAARVTRKRNEERVLWKIYIDR